MKDKFVNLHLHTHYSVQDSTIKIPDLFFHLKQNKQKAVAITDHGSVEGWNEFFLVGRDTNIKTIFGCEFYCKEFFHKPTNNDRFHLVVLAKNDKGIININELQFESEKHKYRKPLLPYPLLFDQPNDIFISTACLLGTLGQCLDVENHNYNIDKAYTFLNTLLDVFGKENVALEFQFHPDLSKQGAINELLLQLWDDTDVKYCIATTDAHFINNPDVRRKVQAASWHQNYDDTDPTLKSNCVGTSNLVKKFAEESNFSDLKLVDTMIDNTSIIADKCNVKNVNNIDGPKRVPVFNKHKAFKKIFFKPPKKVI